MRRSAEPRRARAQIAIMAVSIGALGLGASACGSDAPAPGEQLERDGESPLITDPGGVANQLTNDEISDD